MQKLTQILCRPKKTKSHLLLLERRLQIKKRRVDDDKEN